MAGVPMFFKPSKDCVIHTKYLQNVIFKSGEIIYVMRDGMKLIVDLDAPDKCPMQREEVERILDL